jgi:hypothetical protein
VQRLTAFVAPLLYKKAYLNRWPITCIQLGELAWPSTFVHHVTIPLRAGQDESSSNVSTLLKNHPINWSCELCLELDDGRRLQIWGEIENLDAFGMRVHVDDQGQIWMVMNFEIPFKIFEVTHFESTEPADAENDAVSEPRDDSSYDTRQFHKRFLETLEVTDAVNPHHTIRVNHSRWTAIRVCLGKSGKGAFDLPPEFQLEFFLNACRSAIRKQRDEWRNAARLLLGSKLAVVSPSPADWLKQLSWSSQYLLECLFCSSVISAHHLNGDAELQRRFVELEEQSVLPEVLEELALRIGLRDAEYLSEHGGIKRLITETIADAAERCRHSATILIHGDQESMRIRRITITPLRTYCHPPKEEAANRGSKFSAHLAFIPTKLSKNYAI